MVHTASGRIHKGSRQLKVATINAAADQPIESAGVDDGSRAARTVAVVNDLDEIVAHALGGSGGESQKHGE